MAPTLGIRRQLDISLGHDPVSLPEWRHFGLTMFPNNVDCFRAINQFRNFCGLAPLTTDLFPTNNSTSIVSPFNPAAKLSVTRIWQVNDPHVHQPPGLIAESRSRYWTPLFPATNESPASLGGINHGYLPWGGHPGSKFEGPFDYALGLKDPGVYTVDDWNFPAGESASPHWLGRVHRGTPWQSIYLKSEAAPGWLWTNQSSTSRTHPTNDWRLFEWFVRAWNTNTASSLVSIHSTNAAIWATAFTGLTVLSNHLPGIAFQPPGHFETNIIAPGAAQIETLVTGIAAKREASRGQYFPGLGALLSVPELSTFSPWLNQAGDEAKWGLSDEAYEILPAQLLSRVRADPVGSAAFAGDGIELRFTAWEGNYQVESSDDFSTWEHVSSPHAPTNGWFRVTVPNGAERRFYRARLLP